MPTSSGMDAGPDPRVTRSRARLLAAATDLLVAGGPRAVTVDAVAEHSGVAKSTLYRHWESVHELLLDVVRANVPETRPVDLTDGFETALRAWMAQGVDALSAPDWSRVLSVMIELRASSDAMAGVLEEDFEEQLAAIAEILALGVDEGRFTGTPDPRITLQGLVGPLVLAALTGEDRDHLERLASDVLSTFLAAHPTAGSG